MMTLDSHYDFGFITMAHEPFSETSIASQGAHFMQELY